MNLLDLLLFPTALYQKLTDRKGTLYAGILFVGVLDVVFLLAQNYERFFKGKAQDALAYNILFAVVCIVVSGIVDVVFFSVPLFDLFKKFRTEPGSLAVQGTLIKLIKVYITAHFILIPIEVFIFIVSRNIEGVRPGVLILAQLLALVLPIWFSAAITRGINSIYSFQPLFKRLVFLAVFLWSYILSEVFAFVLGNWATALFR